MIAASGNADPKNENPKYRTYPEVDELPAPARWDGVLAIGASKDGSTLADEKDLTIACMIFQIIHSTILNY